MLRFVAVTTLIALVAAACSDDSTSGELTPARPGAEVAGNVVTSFAPEGSERVSVIGLSQGETLPLYAMPGTLVVAQIPSTADDLFGFGESFQTEDGRLWWLVRWENEQGWIVPGAAFVSPPDDVSARIAGSLANSRYDSVDTLLAEVAVIYGSADFALVSQSRPDASGAVTSVIDVLRDDLVIAGQRVEIITVDEGGVRLTAANQSWLCNRGIDDGACAT